ncbi:WXG100 family type VII secretion target [Rhodococcus sp. BP22]|uniref:WXG100 family type VII secretion target n=1 Tax=Rhodococcus sp. BP22 TaxID=2758566 RepID=UPI00164617FE|nr:WXG100 family type VII secretion target [Rhodococcus sp. BP22]
MSEAQATPDDVRATASNIEVKADDLGERLRRLDNTVGRELLVGWRGSTASAYDESWVEWRHGAEVVISRGGTRRGFFA